MATQIICDFKENDKANPCGTPAVWRIAMSVHEDGKTNTVHGGVLGIDSCGQHVAQLTAMEITAATKPDLGTRVSAAMGNAPSALGQATPRIAPDKVRLREITIAQLRAS